MSVAGPYRERERAGPRRSDAVSVSDAQPEGARRRLHDRGLRRSLLEALQRDCSSGQRLGRIRGGSLGGVSERFNVGVLKTPGRKPRGFESLPLRQFLVPASAIEHTEPGAVPASRPSCRPRVCPMLPITLSLEV